MRNKYLKIRRKIGRLYYIFLRYVRWSVGPQRWAQQQVNMDLDQVVMEHDSPLMRSLPAVEMYLQVNKVTNLRLAAATIDRLVIQPGETFSFWYRVKTPSRRKGYLPGLVLQNGRVGVGIGGGLCQMGNLLYWMAIHSPLTITERWRHGYDVFPDDNRTLPFGSGATLSFNYIDLQFRNDTKQPFQLRVWLTESELRGAIRTDKDWPDVFKIAEAGHEIRPEPWGGYSRHNQLMRYRYDKQTGMLLETTCIAENHALLMYQPFLKAEAG